MPIQDTYRAHLKSTLEQRKMPGAGVFVRRGSEVLFDEGVGYADREASRPVTTETIFGIGSVTKCFTTVAIMQLVDAGKLRVSDRVCDYLPAFERSGDTDLSGITLHHLMTNSSGLPPLPFLAQALVRSYKAEVSKELLKIDVEKLPEPIDTADELVEAIAGAGIELLAPPGETFSYSNDGFAMLGRIVELASGMGYEEYVHEHVLEPLGMSRSLFDAERLPGMGDVAELYSYIDGFDRVEVTPGWWYAPSMTSAGFLKSTARDMGRYAELFFGNRPDVLSPESVAAMTQPHIVTGGDGRYYGYGLMVQPDYQGRKLVEHGGNIKGVAAYFTMLPEEQLVSVVLNNITGGPTGGMALAGINLALGLPTSEKRVSYPSASVPATAVDKMIGHFKSQEGAAIEFARAEDGSVRLKMQTISLGARPVSADKLLVDLNGDEAAAYFRDPGADGYEAVFFGFRVLKRYVPEPAADTGDGEGASEAEAASAGA